MSIPPRFRSQVFSTSQRFPSRPKFRGLVSCHNRSWDSSFRDFPSQKSQTPLEIHSAPVWLSTAVLKRRLPVLVAAGFSDVHAFTQLPGFSTDYGLPFHAPERTLPGQPGSERRNSFRFASFTHFEALILLRVRSRRLELPLACGRSSPGFSPL
jgi:hypothetical protein